MRRAKGAGTVEKIGNKYRARVTVHGERIVGPLRETRAQAEKDRPNLIQRQAKPSEVPTLAEFSYDCLNGRFATGAKAHRRSTWETNEIIWRTRVSPSKLGRMKLDQIKKRDVQAFVDDLGDVSRSWRVRIGAFVSKVFSEAVEDEYILMNPAYKVKYPEEEERENITLSPKDAIKLLNPKDRIGAMILVAAHTGLRRGELCGLRWQDFKGDHITVRKAISAIRGGDVEAGVKTKTSMSNIPLTKAAKEAIEQQPRRGKYVFSVEDGGPISPSNLSRDWRTWADKNKLDPRMRLHDLRGSYISLLIENGADIRTVQELARHADPRTTMKVYARSRQSVKNDAISKLETLIGGKPKRKPRQKKETGEAKKRGPKAS